ncbi:MAG: hypothetical protein ABIE55_00140 [Candidatus Aenigmatarchaeota archaeon]
MKAKILMLVLATVLVAGCVGIDIPGAGGIGVGAGNGLEIISFTAEPSSVFSGNSVRLIMEIENRGGTTVPSGLSKVYITGSNYDAWNGDVASTDYQESISQEMRAEDVVRGVPASTKRVSLTLTAPPLSPGQTRNDIFIGRVYHDYNTTANGNIWVYGETEAEAARAAGRQIYTPSFTYTKGPVGLSVSVSPTPVVLYGTDNRFTLYIKINNLASGTIYHPGSIVYSGNSVGLNMAQINNVSVIINEGTGLSRAGTECTAANLLDQELVAGRELTLVCDFTVNTIPSTFQSYPFDITVKYGYYTERTTSVTVQGR